MYVKRGDKLFDIVCFNLTLSHNFLRSEKHPSSFQQLFLFIRFLVYFSHNDEEKKGEKGDGICFFLYSSSWLF